MNGTPARRPPRRRKWLRRIVLLLASLAFAGLLGEGLVRLWFGWRSGWATWDGSLTMSGAIGDHDPTLGYRLTPGAEGRIRGPEFDVVLKINGQGMRMDSEVTNEKPPGKRRILVFGDSFSFGHGVRTGERYSDVLASLLDGVEAVNSAVWASGTDQQYLLFRERVAEFPADLVILGYLVENIVRNGRDGMLNDADTMSGKPRFVLKDGELVLTNVPVPRELRAIAAAERKEETGRGTGIPIPFKDFLRRHSALYKLMHRSLRGIVQGRSGAAAEPFPEYREDGPAWQVTRALFRKFHEECRARGTEFLLVIIPTHDYAAGSPAALTPFTMVAGACQADGIPCLDLLPALRAAGEPVHYRMDQHLNAAGHRVAARAIADRLLATIPWCRPAK